MPSRLRLFLQSHEGATYNNRQVFEYVGQFLGLDPRPANNYRAWKEAIAKYLYVSRTLANRMVQPRFQIFRIRRGYPRVELNMFSNRQRRRNLRPVPTINVGAPLRNRVERPDSRGLAGTLSGRIVAANGSTVSLAPTAGLQQQLLGGVTYTWTTPQTPYLNVANTTPQPTQEPSISAREHELEMARERMREYIANLDRNPIVDDDWSEPDSDGR